MRTDIKDIVRTLPTKVKLYQRGYTLYNQTWPIYSIGGHWAEGVTLYYKARKRGVPSTLQDAVRVDIRPAAHGPSVRVAAYGGVVMNLQKLKGYDVRVSHYDGVTQSFRPMFTYEGVPQKDLVNVQVWLDLQKIRSKLS